MRVMWGQLACTGWGTDEVGAGTEPRGAGDVAVGDAGATIGVQILGALKVKVKWGLVRRVECWWQ